MAQQTHLSAERLADLPNAAGLAAVFAGTSGDALLVAGGTNFPDKKPWEGGTKHWHDEIYVLDSPDGQWKTGFRLPRPLAHGASVSTPEGLICIGGGDADRAFTDVFMLIWRDNKLQRRELPPLPQPVCSAAAALVGQTIYLAGGSSSTDPLASESLHQLLALDLSAAQPKWRQLPPWPGPGRYFPVAASHGGKFYLFTGMRRASDEQGRRKIEFLTDAYCYTPGGDDSPGHWRRLADLPVAKAAAPTPAVAIDEHRLAILGGGVAP
ncbi:MAG TPA: hypothetical protein VNL70_11410, partial [Tepidisphaeraceae bacterium]|nr:hypothetical protein [Tepidisphaeraceae bacterium]